MFRSVISISLLLGGLHLIAEPLEQFRPVPVQEKPIILQLRSAMRQVVIPRLYSPNLLNGITGWEKAFCDDQFTVIHTSAIEKAKGRQASGDWQNFMDITLLPSQKTEIKLGYDNRNLYLAANCHEKMMEQLAMPISSERDSAVYGGDCLDILLSKNRLDPHYFQLVVNGGGKRYDAIIHRSNGQIIADKSWNPNYQLHTALNGNSWLVIMAIPFQECGLQLKDGDFLDINICRNEIPFKEASSWGAVEKSFHEKARMVRIWLGNRTPPQTELESLCYLPPRIGENQLQIVTVNSQNASFTGSLLLIVKSENKVITKQTKPIHITAKGQSNHKLSWLISQPGNYTVEISLLNDSQVQSTTTYSIQVPPLLTLGQTNLEILTGTRTINGNLNVNIVDPAQYQLRFHLNGKTSTVALKKATQYMFTLNSADLKEKTFLRVELFDPKTQRSVAEETLSINLVSDPFDEG